LQGDIPRLTGLDPRSVFHHVRHFGYYGLIEKRLINEKYTHLLFARKWARFNTRGIIERPSYFSFASSAADSDLLGEVGANTGEHNEVSDISSRLDYYCGVISDYLMNAFASRCCTEKHLLNTLNISKVKWFVRYLKYL
jgi:hypothetical protein